MQCPHGVFDGIICHVCRLLAENDRRLSAMADELLPATEEELQEQFSALMDYLDTVYDRDTRQAI